MARKLYFITPALCGGGIESSTHILLKNLRGVSDLEFHWIGINNSAPENFIDGAMTASLGRSSGDGLWKTLGILMKFRKVICMERNAIVVANGELAELLAFALPNRIQIVCVEHASMPWSLNRALGFLVRKKLSKSSIVWVTVNSLQETIWPRIRKFSIICNPIESTAFNEKDQAEGLVHVGRVTADKGVTLTCVAADSTGLSLDVYGEGKLRPQLQANYGRNPNIWFHGYVKNVWERIGPNKLFISASMHEGDGRNIAEAIIRGQPLLLLDTRDNRRFGLPDIFYFRDVDSLVSKIRSNSANSFLSLRPSMEVSMREMKKRDPHFVVGEWNSLLTSIAKSDF